jgi:Domain of unknown function (DUF3598)
MKSQWECFLQNLGEWHGSFTRLSTQGEILEDTPSVLKLEQKAERLAHLNLKRDSPQYKDLEMDFSDSFSLGLLFFESGHFCQGSPQLGFQSEFGAEFGFIHHDRRLRLVQMYGTDRQLRSLTLIREQRAESGAPERPPLQIEDLIGTWEGEAVTIYPDLRSPTSMSTSLKIWRERDRLHQEFNFGARAIVSSAQIQGSVLLFDQGATPIQIVLLPDGASSNCPQQIQSGQPFVLEVGWLVEPNLRQRLVRSYSEKGEWINITLVTERRTEAILS